jgi:undecaprenyl-phosphate galactose phosphotransferase
MLLLKKYSNDQLLDFIKAMGLSLMVIGSAGLLLSKETPLIVINSEIIFVSFSMAVCVILAVRLTLVHLVFNKIMRRIFRRQMLIIGSDKEAGIITNHIIDHDAPFWVVGNLGVKEPGSFETSIPKGCLGRLKDLPDIVETEKIDEIIVTDEDIDKAVLISLLDYCTTTGLTAWFPPKLLKIIDMKLYIDNFCGIPMIKLCSQKNTWFFNKVKHAMDALMALPIFIIQLPLFLLIAVAIKLNSKGPVFYLASSIGKNGREFKMYKFRSMRVDSDNNIHKNYVSKLIKGEIGKRSDQGETLKITNDDRITSVGRILRKYSLDELPQLINVLKGEMSLIGPRPCLPYEYEIYEDWHKKRVFVRPGITGLWQVTGRSEVSFEDMILLDLYYIYNKNLIMDFNILYETLFAVLQKRGAY